MMRMCGFGLIGLMLWTLAGNVNAQAPDTLDVLRDRPDAEETAGGGDHRLGKVFESRAAGIAFRGPAGCTEHRGGGGELVRYTSESKKWTLSVRHAQFPQPVALVSPGGQARTGLLEMTLDEFRREQPGAEILRDDVMPVGEAMMGIFAARYNVGLDTLLHQRGLVRASDRNYFIFTFTTPAPRSGDPAEDTGVRDAVETFNAVLDSVRLLDMSDVRQDQDQRLFRTRALFLHASENRLRDTLDREQWMRLVRNGKDIGYMYVVEEVANDLPRRQTTTRRGGSDGVLVGIRSRMLPQEGVQIDSESWMWMSFDRRHEKWFSVATIAAGEKRDVVSEFGASDLEVVRTHDRKAELGELRPDGTVDRFQPPLRQQEVYTLTATHFSRGSTAQPIRRELPVFYMPQAFGHLLPRLVPRFEPKGYMFASYDSEHREVKARYVDVEREEEVVLDGQRVRAIPVRDRVGLEGAATTHYISPEGAYLGSINRDTGVSILPTDAATLKRIWADVNLTRPDDVEQE